MTLGKILSVRQQFERFLELFTTHETIENKCIVPILEKRVPDFTHDWFHEHDHLQQTSKLLSPRPPPIHSLSFIYS
jgi:hypothetical protein